MNVAHDLIRRLDEMTGRRAPWEGHWQELADYVLPRRGDISRPAAPGAKRSPNIFDGTAIEANEILAAGLHGMLTSPATPWFELSVRDGALAGDHGILSWLDAASKDMHAALNASNFQTEVHELYLDLGCFGTAAMFVEEDAERLVRFSTRTLSEIFVAQNAAGRIDTVFRRFSFTARQAVQRFGEKAVGERVRKIFRENADSEIELLHAVFPREERNTARRDSRNMPIASIYVDVAGRHVLSEGGFQEFPYVVPRWSKASGEVFGRSPAMKALADIKMLNEMCRTTIKAAQKVVDPPLLIADDGVMLPVRTTPASLNYARFLADGTDPIRPLRTSADVGLGLRMEEGRRNAIRSAFFVDQLQLAGSPQMTATEVLQRTEEKLRLLGPMLGRLQTELLMPLIDRVYGIMVRSEALPEPPARLAGAEAEIVFVSPIARAQRSTEARGLLNLMEIAGPLAQFQPDILDNIDGDGALKHLWSLFSIPQGLLRDEREVGAIRRGRAEQVQAETAKDDAERLVGGLSMLGLNGDAGEALLAGGGDGR